MESLLAIPYIDMIFRIIIIVLFFAFSKSATSDLLKSMKTQGFRKSIDELLVVGLWFLLAVFVLNNLVEISKLLDIVFNGVLKLLGSIVDYIFGRM